LTMSAIIGVTLMLAHYTGLATRRIRLPSLIGYMVLGVVFSSSALGVFDEESLEKLAFIPNLALGLVAFSIGLELNVGSLRTLGRGIIYIIFAESLMAFGVVTAAVYLLTSDMPMALVFGAMAPASAPAGTVAVIHECRARGPLTKALYAVVGFDDGLAIVIFGFAYAMARSLLVGEAGGGEASMLPELVGAAKEIGLSMLFGGVIGLLLSLLVARTKSGRDMLVLSIASTLIGIGISAQFHLSLVLTNMVVGFVLVNRQRESVVHEVMSQLANIMPLLFILFFSLAGAHIKLASLPSLGLLGMVYVLARSAGLVGGARVGAIMGRAGDNVRKYLGLGILSQAGVAIGLALVVSNEFTRIGSSHAVKVAGSVLTTVTATSIFFEFVGPILTKFALERAGEIPK